MRGLRLLETRRARSLRRDATSAERILWQHLKGRALSGFKFVRQMPIGPYIADFVCREMKLVVEIDGATHSSDEEIAADNRRTQSLEELGFRVIRFTNAAVFESVEGVTQAHPDGTSEIQLMRRRGLSPRPSPSLSPQAGRGAHLTNP